MHYPEFPYHDRTDAGRRLAKHLKHYRGSDAVVFAIPRGGIPVAVEIAMALNCDLDIIVPRKIPIPFNTEAGYGAVTEDGVIVLNDTLVRELQLTEDQIRHHAQKVMAEIKRRQEVFRKVLAPISVEGKQALVVDDGLASGYTMVAAIKSLRKRGASAVVAAVPVSSGGGWKFVQSEVDEVVCPIVSSTYPFSVASFYEQWSDLTDEEVIESLEVFKKKFGGRHD
jgi:putative phosphoribosyl transferase